jgi:dipeptidyl aminopeptidase/acylaminoacyl peptidase
MKALSHLLLIYVLYLGCANALLAQGSNLARFTTDDALDVRSLSVGDITDDGRYVATTIGKRRDRMGVQHKRFGDPTYVSPNYRELVVIDAENGNTQQVFDRLVQVRSLAWSPDGTTLAFFLRDGDTYLLYIYERERERTRKIILRSDLAIASNSYLQWTPDGSAVLLALRTAAWADSASAAFLNLTEGPIIVRDSRKPFLAWEELRNRSGLQVHVRANPSNGEVEELLPESRITGLRQTEDGKYLTYTVLDPKKTGYLRNTGTEYEFVRLDLTDLNTTVLRNDSTRRRNRTFNETSDRYAYAERGNVFVRTILEDSATNITEEYRTPISEDDSTKLSYGVELWSHDNSRLLLASQHGYHIYDLQSGDLELVYPLPEDREEGPRIDVIQWSQDGRYLYMTHSAREQWERGLVRFDLETRQERDLVKDANLYSGWRFSKDGNRIFYNFSDGDTPNELYVADVSVSSPKQLTDLNPWLTDRKLTRSELVKYLDIDGNELYGVLYYPVDYEPGKKYPLVCEIYERFFNNGFHTNMNLITNAGFFGFRPSVELEEGFPGEAWMKGITTGINSLIERGLVDKDKIGVHGTSYGGYAANLLITQTDRFAAAINISGKVNIISFLGDSPRIGIRNYSAAERGQDRIGATLWEQPQKYIAHSAIMYADRIDTPLLLITGEGDWNVPGTNTREMYYALRRLGKEVVWVNYYLGGHGINSVSSPAEFADAWGRIIGWYDEHFEKTDEKKEAAATSDSG